MVGSANDRPTQRTTSHRKSRYRWGSNVHLACRAIVRTTRVTRELSVRTSLARTSKQDGLEPCREIVHDREVACRDQEVADSHEYRDLLLQKRGRQDRFDRDAELEYYKGDEENGREDKRDKDGRR